MLVGCADAVPLAVAVAAAVAVTVEAVVKPAALCVVTRKAGVPNSKEGKRKGRE